MGELMVYKYTYQLVEPLEDGTEIVNYNGLKSKHLALAEKFYKDTSITDQEVCDKLLVEISDLGLNQIENLNLIDGQHFYREVMIKQILPFRNERLSVAIEFAKSQGLYEGIQDKVKESLEEPDEELEADLND